MSSWALIRSDVTSLSLSFYAPHIRVKIPDRVRNSMKAQSYFHNSYS